MRKIVTIIICLLICLIAGHASGCTIVMLSKGNLVLAGNNEDWKDPFTSMWFIPASEDAYGRVCFGFGNTTHNPQGGMNDQGLFIDGNAVGSTGWQEDPDKAVFRGHVIDYILAHCSTVEEAKAFFEKYNMPALDRARFPIADRYGNSMVAEWSRNGLQLVEKEGDYQISTNFVISNFTPDQYPCYRYRTADQILKHADAYSIDLVREILSATHAEGNYPTNYSNIYDLANLKVYVYNFHNFEDVLVFDLEEELKKGQRQMSLRSIFPYTTHMHNTFLSRSGTALIYDTITSISIERGIARYHELKRRMKQGSGIDVVESDLNSLGYQLLREGKVEEAIALFELNVEEYPDSWNVYDSLAEGYMTAGKKDLAVEYYKKSLELNPENQNARDAVERLQKE